MSLNPQFRELGMEFSRITKKEIENLKFNAKKVIDSIEAENQYKIRKDLQELITEYQQKTEIEIKKKLSDRINELNMQILEIKTQYSQKLTEKAITEIKNRKKKNPEGYWNYILKSLQQLRDLIQTECSLMINQDDLDLFQKKQDFLAKKYPKLSIISSSEDFFGGFKILSKDNQIEIDETIKNMIQRHQNEISRIISLTSSQCIVQMTDAI